MLFVKNANPILLASKSVSKLMSRLPAGSLRIDA